MKFLKWILKFVVSLIIASVIFLMVGMILYHTDPASLQADIVFFVGNTVGVFGGFACSWIFMGSLIKEGGK